MVVFLSEADVQAAITMPETMAIVEAAFRDYARGEAALLPRISHTLPGSAGMFRILPAVLPTQNMFGLKTLTGFPGRRQADEIYFAILLFDMVSGALRAVISANYLTGLRTGAASGVAAKYLARPDATSMGIAGAGVQAWYQAEALCAVRDVRTAKIFSRNRKKAEELARRIQDQLRVAASVVDSAEEAVRDSSLVVTATTASTPVIEGAWLRRGAHVSGIGANTRNKQELDADCFRQARVVADSREQVLEESGDVRAAIASGAVGPEVIYAELGDLAAGLKQGRMNGDEITIFKSVGVALQDVAVAAALFENAQRLGLGAQLDPYAYNQPFVDAL